MCQRVFEQLSSSPDDGNDDNGGSSGSGLRTTARCRAQLLADVRKLTRLPDYTPSSWQELCGKLFVTCYMASEYSGDETRERAALLAEQIGSVHTSIMIDDITAAIQSTFADVTVHSGRAADAAPVRSEPQMEGGTATENLALQNIQARSRTCSGEYICHASEIQIRWLRRSERSFER
jgi:hypothetical protein